MTEHQRGANLPPMRMLWMVVVVVLVTGASGCRKRVVIVPNTPEGLSCQRDCMTIYYSCRRSIGWCKRAQSTCLETCPGAMFSDGRPAVGTYGTRPPSSSSEPE